MKFLCVPCDQPMKLTTVGPPDRGSLSVRYSCPACGYEMAMLTNPYETQVVQSLGVRVGGGEKSGAEATMPDRTPGAGPAGDGVGDAGGGPGVAEGGAGARCPFAGMIGDLDAPGEAARAGTAAGGAASPGSPGDPASGPASAPVWTEKARDRMKAIPAFVRPMARTGIERFARERGYATIDETVLEEARAFFGM